MGEISLAVATLHLFTKYFGFYFKYEKIMLKNYYPRSGRVEKIMPPLIKGLIKLMVNIFVHELFITCFCQCTFIHN